MLKRWQKNVPHKGKKKENVLNSFSLYMMLLHVMQVYKLIPNIQQLSHLQKQYLEVKMVKGNMKNPEYRNEYTIDT